MRKFSLSLVVCVFAAFAVSQVKLGSPAQTIQSFASAIEAGKVDDAAKCVVGAKLTSSVRQTLESVATQGMKIIVTTQTPVINGLKATVPLAVTIRVAHQGSQSLNETVSLKKSGNSWYILAPKGSIPNMSFINSAAYMLVNGDKKVNPDLSDKTTACMMNAKQLALGCLMYAADYDDVFKFKATGWTNAIMPYIKNKAILTCPLDKPGTISYSFNTSLIGKNQAVIARPAETVMLYEGKNKKLLFRHGGKAVVAYADGHVKLVSKDDAKNLIWKP